MHLDSSSATPLYLQLKNLLTEQIQTGKLKGGDQIPTETELCQKYNIGRNTVRNAIKELTEEGYLIKKQGKGTFVQCKTIEENVNCNASFTSVCRANGMVPSNKLVTLALQPASKADIEALHVAPDSMILYIARVLYADGIPVIFDRLYLTEKYSDLIRENLDNVSVYELLYKKFHVIMSESHKTIELAYANEEESKLLNIDAGDPVLLMNETVFDSTGEPVHRTKQIILGDRFKYSIR
ncbi:MAG: GntR family transcriptional regulator [Eubacteriales bacterium]|nr:GntR family transcriptional regulator [Eubacteriales bacterium]